MNTESRLGIVSSVGLWRGPLEVTRRCVLLPETPLTTSLVSEHGIRRLSQIRPLPYMDMKTIAPKRASRIRIDHRLMQMKAAIVLKAINSIKAFLQVGFSVL